jgi:acyl-CoA hydrolase
MNQAVPLSDSHTEMTELLLPDNTNMLGRALGGTILRWMDVCGAIAAMRFANRPCVTASIDHVDFIAPIDVGEIVSVTAYVFNTGETSIDVKVDVQAEDAMTGDERAATASFLTYVAVDDDGTPVPVPALNCTTDEETQLRAEAIAEREHELERLVDRLA